MGYGLEFKPEALGDLRRLDKAVAQRIMTRLRWLSDNVELLNLEPLAGEFKEVFKFRVGDYRAAYALD